MTITPEQRDSYERFLADARARWEHGGLEYEGRTYDLSEREIVIEAREEMLDFANYMAMVAFRLEQRLALLDGGDR